MAPKIALALVALFVVQVSLVSCNVRDTPSSAKLNYIHKLNKRVQESQKSLIDDLAKARKWLENFSNQSKMWLEQANRASREKIQQAMAEMQATKAAVDDCWEEHGDEEQAIKQHFAEKSQTCVDNNIGPVEEAAQKFQDDLDYYVAVHVELVNNFTNCGFSIRCQSSVLKKMAAVEIEQTKTLAADYFALNQAATLAAYDIRACEKKVFAETIEEYNAFQQMMEQCIRDKEATTTEASSQVEARAVQPESEVAPF